MLFRSNAEPNCGEALVTEIERLRAALARIASFEAFDISRTLDPKSDMDAELLARMDYALAALNCAP